MRRLPPGRHLVVTTHYPRRPQSRPKNAADLVGRPWDTTPGRVALAIFVIGGAGFALLLIAVSTSWAGVTDVDRSVTRWMAQAMEQAAAMPLVRGVDLILSPIVLRVITLVVAVGIFRSGLRRVALWLAGTVVGGWFLTWLVKELVQRPRPEIADFGIGFGIGTNPYAFPSGHALTSALLAGALLFVGLQRPNGRRYRHWFWLAATALVLVVGFNRVALVAHHVSDVLAGWALALAILGVSMLVFGVTRPGHLPQVRGERPPHRYRLAVVINPAKIDDDRRFRRRLEDLASVHGWSAPLWLETTAHDAGHAMTKTALSSGVDLVIVAGGDGTVRAVCTELAGSQVAVGIVPIGTGNLLARNLGLPLDHEDAIEVALTGHDRAIDSVRVDGDGLDTERFVVMAGLGLDAAVVGEAPPELKARAGWPAYVVSLARNLSYPAERVTIEVDDAPPARHWARMVMIGNVGQLHGGLPLLPDAAPDDGTLDIVLFAPRRVTEWPRLAWRVVTRSRKADEQLTHWRGHSVIVRASEPVPRQLDGDVLPPGRELCAHIEPGALIVRVPTSP